MNIEKYIGRTRYPDTPLVRKAMDTPCIRWSEIYALMDETDNLEEKEALNSIASSKYHMEEGRDI